MRGAERGGITQIIEAVPEQVHSLEEVTQYRMMQGFGHERVQQMLALELERVNAGGPNTKILQPDSVFDPLLYRGNYEIEKLQWGKSKHSQLFELILQFLMPLRS